MYRIDFEFSSSSSSARSRTRTRCTSSNFFVRPSELMATWPLFEVVRRQTCLRGREAATYLEVWEVFGAGVKKAMSQASGEPRFRGLHCYDALSRRISR